MLSLGALIAFASPSEAGGKKPTEDDYYKILRFQVPFGVVLEGGAIEMLPNKKVAVSSRRGDIWIVDLQTGAPG